VIVVSSQPVRGFGTPLRGIKIESVFGDGFSPA